MSTAQHPWRPNPGRQPDETRGKRVIVKLANGAVCGEKPVSTTAPTGWAADTTRWTKLESALDVAEYRLV